MYYSISNFYCAYGAICYTNWSLLIHGTCITSMLVLSCVWSPHYFLWHLFMTKKKTHVYHLLNVYHMMSDSANMLDSWWLWILFLLSCIIYNHLYPWAIHLLLWDLTVCTLLFPACLKEGLYMYFTSLHLSEYMQWLSILSVIKKYLRHFLKNNFEMLAKPLVPFLRISLSMYERNLENFLMLFTTPNSDSLILSLGGLPNINWCR